MSIGYVVKDTTGGWIVWLQLYQSNNAQESNAVSKVLRNTQSKWILDSRQLRLDPLMTDNSIREVMLSSWPLTQFRICLSSSWPVLWFSDHDEQFEQQGNDKFARSAVRQWFRSVGLGSYAQKEKGQTVRRKGRVFQICNRSVTSKFEFLLDGLLENFDIMLQETSAK